MKEFFEDLGKFITETAGSVGKKTEEVMEVQKLKNQIRNLERSNQKDLTDLGKIIYERFQKEEGVDAELGVICEEIRKRRMIIAAFERKLADMRGVKECESCHEFIEKDMKFCPYCGAERKKEEATETCEDIFEESDEIDCSAEKETTAEVIEDIMERAADVTKETAEQVKESVHEAKEQIKESVDDLHR